MRKLKPYIISYRDRYDVNATGSQVRILAYNRDEAKRRFYEEYQQYDMYANPLFTIISNKWEKEKRMENKKEQPARVTVIGGPNNDINLTPKGAFLNQLTKVIKEAVPTDCIRFDMAVEGEDAVFVASMAVGDAATTIKAVSQAFDDELRMELLPDVPVRLTGFGLMKGEEDEHDK